MQAYLSFFENKNTKSAGICLAFPQIFRGIILTYNIIRDIVIVKIILYCI